MIGVLVTVALMSLAFFLSLNIYTAHAKEELLKNVDASFENIKLYFNDSIPQNELVYVRDYILQEYEADPTTSTDPDIDKRYAYFRDKYATGVYETEQPSLSLPKVQRQSDYRNLSTSIMYAVRMLNPTSAFIAYKDTERNRFVYIVDFNYMLEKSYNSYTRFPGDYYQIIQAEDPYSTLTLKHVDLYEDGDYLATVFIEYDMNTINAGMREFITAEAIALSCATVVMVAIFVLLSHFAFTKNIAKLKDSALEFSGKASSGQALTVINPSIKAKDEIGELSKTFVELENELIAYTERVSQEAKEKERMTAELSIASEIQSEELPSGSFADGRVKVVADYTSAKEVGGDFYDYFYIDKDRFAVVIADVSGKGIPAALFMMKAKGLIRNKLKATGNVEQTAFEVNNQLLENNKSALFITAFIGVIDLKTKVMQCISAGHEKPYFIDKKAKKIEVESNFILGGQKNFVYKKDEIDVSDKKIFLFTDGLNEAINDKFEEFGYQRIEKALSTAERSNEKILKGVKNSLKEFVGENEAFDDATLMIIDVKEPTVQAEFDKPGYEIIEQVTDTFNSEFSFIDKDTLGMLDVVIDEMLNNLVSYEKTDNLKVGFTAKIKNGDIVMEFTGNGEKFDPLSVKEKYIAEGQKDVKAGGFGITITKSFSDQLKYARKDGKNVITVTKNLNKGKS